MREEFDDCIGWVRPRKADPLPPTPTPTKQTKPTREPVIVPYEHKEWDEREYRRKLEERKIRTKRGDAQLIRNEVNGYWGDRRFWEAGDK